MKYEAVIDLIYPCGRVQMIVHRAPFAWLARLTCWSYEYGPAFMPLAGGAVTGMAFVRRAA